jgi:hypothetical protein
MESTTLTTMHIYISYVMWYTLILVYVPSSLKRSTNVDTQDTYFTGSARRNPGSTCSQVATHHDDDVWSPGFKGAVVWGMGRTAPGMTL